MLRIMVAVVVFGFVTARAMAQGPGTPGQLPPAGPGMRPGAGFAPPPFPGVR